MWLWFACVLAQLFVLHTGDFVNRPRGDDIPGTSSWVELQQVYDWVVETKGYKPVVIDAADLIENPGRRCSAEVRCRLRQLFL